MGNCHCFSVTWYGVPSKALNAESQVSQLEGAKRGSEPRACPRLRNLPLNPTSPSLTTFY